MTENCEYCGGAIRHVGMCPRIAAIEYHENGSIKRVEFVAAQPIVRETYPNNGGIKSVTVKHELPDLRQ